MLSPEYTRRSLSAKIFLSWELRLESYLAIGPHWYADKRWFHRFRFPLKLSYDRNIYEMHAGRGIVGKFLLGRSTKIGGQCFCQVQ